MAQLSDDCFAFGGPLLTIEAARDRLERTLSPVTPVDSVPLAEGLGRVLAADIAAPIDVPPHPNAAVDGYAVVFDDLAADAETVLPVGGHVAAGAALGRTGRRGETVRILTGAPMPAGFDTVVMQEDCRRDGDHVVIPPGLRRGANHRAAGEDVARDSTILSAGCRLRPQELGLLASVGIDRVAVRARLRVALFSTGDEVREPGTALASNCIYDANRTSLTGLLQGLGVAVTDLGILPDDPARIRSALAEAAAGQDLLLTSGGVSTGDEDHVKTAVEALGALHVWRLAIKPGRPVALGTVAGVPFVGLPGNPVAVMVTFMLLARPLILRLAGAAPREPQRFPVIADFDYRKKPERREFVRARLAAGADGSVRARKFPRDGAGILSSMVEADGLVELPELVTEVAPGATVRFLPFSEVL